jgi:predicted LPLAT superfamily acyltransferase
MPMAHWSDQKEAGGRVWQMRLMYRLSRALSFRTLSLCLGVTVFFFYLFAPGSRRVSRKFLSAVARLEGRSRPRSRDVFRHFYCFAWALLEKLAAWSGTIRVRDLDFIGPDLEPLLRQLRERRGAVILCSHLGNTEMLRAVARIEAGAALPDFWINPIVDFTGTGKFNRLLNEINPASMVRLYSASAIGADTIIELSHRLGQGDLVAIAADRTAAGNRSRTGRVSFLGRPAHFPLGAFVLASLLDAPVYHMFAVRKIDTDLKSAYEFHLHLSRLTFGGARRERMVKVQALMEEYVGHLEALCRRHPCQWYNFFDFWAGEDPLAGEATEAQRTQRGK